jgi:hypothetical protein
MRVTGPTTVNAVLPMYSKAGPPAEFGRNIPAEEGDQVVISLRGCVLGLPQHMALFLLWIFVVDSFGNWIRVLFVAGCALQPDCGAG